MQGMSRPAIIALLVLACLASAARWVTYDRDFPPISGSRGEYMDMGVNLYNVRSFLLTGRWEVEASPLLFLCPAYYALELGAAAIFGHNFFAWRFWSLTLGTTCVAVAGLAASRRQGAACGATAALLISSDAIWYAFSRSEKQEVAAAFFLFAAAISLGAESRTLVERAFLTGLFGALSVLSKANHLVPLAGMLLCGIAADRRLIRPGTLASLAIGAGAPSAVTAAFLAHPLTSEGSLALVARMLRFYQGAIMRPESVLDAIGNLINTNLYLRSPVMTFGVGCAVLTILTIRRVSALEAALAGIVLTAAVSPLTNDYFPLRYRILAIPEAALLTALVASRGEKYPGLVFGLAKGAMLFLLTGALAVKFAIPYPAFPAAAVALIGGIVAGRISWRPPANAVVAATMLVSVVVGGGQMILWELEGHNDIPEIAVAISGKLPANAKIATNSWWGRMVLLGTPFPEVGIASPDATAYLLTKEPEGGWSKNKEPSLDFSALEMIYERRSWVGANYMLYSRKNEIRSSVSAKPE